MEFPTSSTDIQSEIDGRKFNAFTGVFVPTVLTILGAIMYLRLGWVVGNAGFGGAIAIILLAHLITISTGLAVSSISTNIRVGAGGAFSIISQSLGLEVGGSISLPLYLAQAVSTTMYVFAFTEGVERVYAGMNTARPFPFALVALAALCVVFVIAYISAKLAMRIQLIILAILTLSLVSVFLGSFPSARQAGMVYTPVVVGDFPDGNNFWTVFAVFFPAVTGIMAGISLSGDLKDPRRAIPRGTLSAIGVTMIIYLLLAYWLARVASVDELLNNTTIMVDKAYFDWIVLAGLLGATFSSALGSLLAAPRVMQALGAHGALPMGSFFARESEGGEPRQAMMATGGVALASTLIGLAAGGLNAIAPLITMFFLITYFMLNAVVFIEQTLSMVSFRPTFAVPRTVPLIGMIGCLFVMFLINPLFSIVAIAATLGVYGYLLNRQLNAPWEDVRSGLFLALAHWTTRLLGRVPPAPERTWSPNILAPVSSRKELLGSYRFLRAIALPHGLVQALGIYGENGRQRLTDLEQLAQAFNEDGIMGRSTLLYADDFLAGARMAMEVLSSTFFRPNILFLALSEKHEARAEEWSQLLSRAAESHMGVMLFLRHPVAELGREQVVNVWVREQSPNWMLKLRLSNLDLSVLLGYQLTQNWNGRINLCMAVQDEETKGQATAYLNRLIELARLPASTTEVLIFETPFMEALTTAPSADLSIFGLQAEPDLAFVKRIFTHIDASCIFVRDSGDESALA